MRARNPSLRQKSIFALSQKFQYITIFPLKILIYKRSPSTHIFIIATQRYRYITRLM